MASVASDQIRAAGRRASEESPAESAAPKRRRGPLLLAVLAAAGIGVVIGMGIVYRLVGPG
jgi:hypothetical protein